MNKILQFLFVFCCCLTTALSKQALVDLNASADNVTVFLNLHDAVLSLVDSSGQLIDNLNTITLADSTVNDPQYFPSITITGDSSSGIDIIYPNATSTVDQASICSDLPQIVLANQSFLSLTGLGYFSITGLSIQFGDVAGFNSLANIGNLTVSQYCFDSTSLISTSFDSFGLNSITSISFLNGVYIYDQTKSINIVTAQSVVIDSIVLAVPTNTQDLYQFGFYVDNTATINSSVTVSNASFACNYIPMVTPALIVAKSSTSTTFSSINITSCDFTLSGSQFYGAVLSAVVITTFVVENIFAQDLYFGAVYDNMFIYSYEISNAYLNDFYVTGASIEGAAGTFNQFLYISSEADQPLNLIANNWTIINNTISNGNSFFLVTDASGLEGSSFQMSNVIFSDCTLDTSSTFITFAITASTNNSVDQTLSLISLDEFEILQSTGSGVNFFQLTISGLEFIPAVEVFQIQATNWILSDNSMNQALFFYVEGLLLQVQNLSAENLTLSASSIFSSQNILSSLFLTNSSFDTITLSAESSIVSYSLSPQRLQVLEDSFDNSGISVYAETRPFIMASCSFNSFVTGGNSVPFIAKNPMIAIQDNNFTNWIATDSLLQLGGYVSMITQQTTYLTSTDIISNDTSFSVFDLAESIIFQNLADVQALFSSARAAVANYDTDNSVYFIVVEGSYLSNITVSSGSLIRISNFEINNGSILTSDTTMQAILLDSTNLYLFQSESVNRFIFGEFSMANVNMVAYVFSISSDSIQNLVIDQNSFFNNTQLASFLIQGTSCNYITIQNMIAQNLILSTNFMSISCMSINGQITISGINFQNISEVAISTIFSPITFVSFLVDTASADNQGVVVFSDSLFGGISFTEQQGYAKGIFASTIFSLLTVGCTISFQNVTFEGIKIVPSGSIIMISAPIVEITNSTFANLTYWNSQGAIELVAQSLTIVGTTFQYNYGLIQNGAGIISLSNSDTESLALVVEIDNCTFYNNKAPYGTVLYLDSASVNFTVTKSYFAENQLTASGGLLYFNNISNSQIVLNENQFNVDQAYELDAPDFNIIAIQAGDNIITVINNTILAVTGDIPGVLLSLIENQEIALTLQALEYIIPNASSSTPSTLYSSSFGVLYADNVVGVISNITVSNAVVNGSTPLFEINCVFGDLLPRVWELAIMNSSFSQLELGRTLILIESDVSNAAPLNNLSISVENCNFLDIVWSGTDGGIVRSLTSYIGKYESEQFYAVTITNCEFNNLSSISLGSIFSGFEPVFGSSLLLLQANNFNVINTQDFGGIIRIYPSTQNIVLDLNVSANSTQDVSPNSTILCLDNSFTQISALSGGVIYAVINQLANDTSQLSINGVSIMFVNNEIDKITVEEKGGVFYLSSVAIASDASTSNVSRRVLPSKTSFSGTIIVLNSSINNLQAQDGGFLYENTQNRSVSITIQGNSIQNSIASSRGGVFYLLEPSISIEDNTFSDCQAAIAGDILFSVSEHLNLDNFVSINNILNCANPFSFAPTNLKIDFISLIDNKPLQLENYATISTNPIVSNLTTYSLSQYQIDFTLVYAEAQGYGVVPDESSEEASLVVEFIPSGEGKIQTHYSSNCSNSVCSTIASEILLSGYAGDLILVNATYTSDIYTQLQQFEIRLRSCLPGEINHTDTLECVACNPGTYSVNLNDTECQECPEGAQCNGGSNIIIKEGYYRSSLPDELYVLDCNDSGTRCLGGYNSSCAESYTGPLCLQCEVEDNYFPAGSNQCSQCATETRLVVIGTFLLIGAVAYQIVMVIVTYRENKKAHKEYEEAEDGEKKLNPGALMVILSTFAQIASIISDFNVGTVSYLLNVSASIGNPNSEAIFSLKCLYYVNIPDPTGALVFQMLFYVFSPFVKIAAVLVVLLLRDACRKTRSEHRKRDLFVLVGAFATVVIVLEQPSIIGILCDYLNCVQLDPNIDDYYISEFNDIQCYNSTYNYILKVIVIPALIFWGVVIPLGIFIIMRRKRRILYKSESMRLVLGNLYNNYSEKAYYWGILIMVMKIIVFIMDSLISSQSLKGLIYLCIFHCYYVAVKRKHPGNHKSLNVAEKYCCIAYMGILTLVFFKNATSNAAINTICNLGILFIVLFAGGYILMNIFWIQVQNVLMYYHKLRIKLMKGKVLRETLEHLQEYHVNENNIKPREPMSNIMIEGSSVTAKRRNAISLDLPARLRQTEKHELALIVAKNNKRVETIKLKKQQIYNRVRRSFRFSKNTTRPSELFAPPSKQTPTNSITLEFRNVQEDRRAETSSIVSNIEDEYSEIQSDSPSSLNQNIFATKKISIATPKSSIFALRK